MFSSVVTEPSTRPAMTMAARLSRNATWEPATIPVTPCTSAVREMAIAAALSCSAMASAPASQAESAPQSQLGATGQADQAGGHLRHVGRGRAHGASRDLQVGGLSVPMTLRETSAVSLSSVLMALRVTRAR